MGVYILKFSEPIGSDKHKAYYYVGYTTNLKLRLKYHKKGRGSAITRYLVKNGIDFDLKVYYPNGDKTLEKSIKAGKNVPRLIRKLEKENSLYLIGD